MQGQRSAVDSLPDSINFDYGSPTSNVGVDQPISWNNLRNPTDTRLSDYRISGSTTLDTFSGGDGQEGRNFSRWNIGESSSSNPHSILSFDDPITQSGWPSTMNDGLRLDDCRYEPTDFVSNTSVNLNLSSNPSVGGPSFVRASDADSVTRNRDSNDGFLSFHRVGDDLNRSHSSSKSIGLGNMFLPSGSSSSDPFGTSSRSGGFLVEEDEGGRRFSCKRKTLEGNAGQSSSSSGNCFLRTTECGMTWQAGPPRYDTNNSVNANISLESSSNPSLRLSMGGNVPSDSLHPPLSVSGGPDTSQRNYRLRVNPSMQQESLPNELLSRAPGSGTRRPLRFVPVSPPLDLMSSSIPSDSSVPLPPSQPLILRVPTLRRNVQAQRWNEAANLRPENSSNSVISSERHSVLPEDLNPRNPTRNIEEHPMFVPQVEARNPTRPSTHWSASSGNVGESRNIPSSSRVGSGSSTHTGPGPSWAPHRQPISQYSRRLSEYVRRSLLTTVGSESAGQGSNNGQLHLDPGSSQEGIPPSSGGNQGHNNQSRSRSALWIERQGEGSLGIPYSLRALAAAGEGRSRLVSELRNVLDSMRRGEGLRFEDVMILDQSVLFGMADIHDQHRDMRLDVDNMSYEELLALEERIGNVCTGLTDDTILNRMKQRKYIHTMSDDQIEAEPCCICQEIYNDGEGIGTLDCGHDFHSECIKQWLTHKNLCPICKTTGLAT